MWLQLRIMIFLLRLFNLKNSKILCFLCIRINVLVWMDLILDFFNNFGLFVVQTFFRNVVCGSTTTNFHLHSTPLILLWFQRRKNKSRWKIGRRLHYEMFCTNCLQKSYLIGWRTFFKNVSRLNNRPLF